MMTIESYAHVHHIVSNVCGQKKNVSPGKVISSVFQVELLLVVQRLDVWKSLVNLRK